MNLQNNPAIESWGTSLSQAVIWKVFNQITRNEPYILLKHSNLTHQRIQIHPCFTIASRLRI